MQTNAIMSIWPAHGAPVSDTTGLTAFRADPLFHRTRFSGFCHFWDICRGAAQQKRSPEAPLQREPLQVQCMCRPPLTEKSAPVE